MFVFIRIHIIHSLLYTPPTNLSTAMFVHFIGKTSYTPSYPLYPQSPKLYPKNFTQITEKIYFCTHLINLRIIA